MGGGRVARFVVVRTARVLVAAVALAGLLGACMVAGGTRVPGAAVPAEHGPDCTPAWATAWMAAAQPAPGGAELTGRTLRMVVHPQVTGSQVRVRLSNAYGATPLTVDAVTAARSDGGAATVPGTLRPVAFAGLGGVTIPPGGDAVSDPVALVSEVGRPLAVSLHLSAVPETLTQHGVALQTSWVSRPGDVSAALDGAAYERPVGSWLVLTGVDVLAPRPVNAVVALGDSITDGVGGAVDADERWSDALARRLAGTGGPAVMSVLNGGLSRNRLLDGAALVEGDVPLARYERDVVAGGASDVVLNIGTNDLAAGRGADEIVAGLVRFVERAHASGARVFLTTITPAVLGAHGTPAAQAARVAVNAWVLAHGREHADGVFEFAVAVADPAHPDRLAPAHDSGDGLHLSAAGYRALAAAIDIASLTGSPCLADPTPARILVSGP